MLGLLAGIYGKVATLRNLLYDKGVFETFDLGARVISVGNLTAGGTGKTPLVALVAEILAGEGETVCILTRGYERENAGDRVLVSDARTILAEPRFAGDEPFELAKKLLGKAIVIADADRVSAGEWAKRKFGVTAFVLDDGFQHRRVRRDLDIVCIDATDPFGGRKMLPAGRLREPVENLERADIVVITRSDLVSDISDLRSEISNLRSKSHELASNVTIFEARNEVDRIIPLEEFLKEENGKNGEAADDLVKEKDVFAFCGIGNPESFFSMLKADGFNIAGTETFRDHHAYTQADIDRIENIARQANAEVLLTTAKDAVKLGAGAFRMPCFVVVTRVALGAEEQFFEKIRKEK